MGFCPTQTTKTLEDLAKLFVDMKLTSTIEDASKIIPLFQGKKLYYTTDMFDTPKKYLEFEKTKDEQGKEAYVITANTASCDYYL